MNVSSSRIHAYFRKTRISAHDSELPMCPACAILYMAKKRFFTEKTRSSSCARSVVRLSVKSCSSSPGNRQNSISSGNGGAGGNGRSAVGGRRSSDEEVGSCELFGCHRRGLKKKFEQSPPLPTSSGEDLCEADSSDFLAR